MHAIDLKYALRALYEEIAEFQFEYPLMAVPEAGPRESLHYYWYKYRKTPPYRRAKRLDENGIARAWSRTTGTKYRPAYIAMHALHHLESYLRNRDRAHLEVFLQHVNWLEDHALVRADGAVVWPNDYDLWEGNTLLRAPWISSNAQGIVMSALVRAWRFTQRPRLLQLLRGSTRIFQLETECKGLRSGADGHIVYAERPGFSAPGIMDGFMTSLLGLYDVYMETDDADVYKLFLDGVAGLKYFLPRWDYRNKWSFYSNRTYLCPPGYHSLNRTLLIILARITSESCFKEYAERWNPDRLSALDRVEIYLAFQLTKNVHRWRCRTWSRR